jgi:hypothetical protein
MGKAGWHKSAEQATKDIMAPGISDTDRAFLIRKTMSENRTRTQSSKSIIQNLKKGQPQQQPKTRNKPGTKHQNKQKAGKRKDHPITDQHPITQVFHQPAAYPQYQAAQGNQPWGQQRHTAPQPWTTVVGRKSASPRGGAARTASQSPTPAAVIFSGESAQDILQHISTVAPSASRLIHSTQRRGEGRGERLVLFAMQTGHAAIHGAIATLRQSGMRAAQFLNAEQQREKKAHSNPVAADKGYADAVRAGGTCKHYLAQSRCPYGAACKFRCYTSIQPAVPKW